MDAAKRPSSPSGILAVPQVSVLGGCFGHLVDTIISGVSEVLAHRVCDLVWESFGTDLQELNRRAAMRSREGLVLFCNRPRH